MRDGIRTVPFGHNNATIRTLFGLPARFIYVLFYVMFKTQTAVILTSDKSGAVRVLTASKTSRDTREYFISIGLLNNAVFFLKRVD